MNISYWASTTLCPISYIRKKNLIEHRFSLFTFVEIFTKSFLCFTLYIPMLTHLPLLCLHFIAERLSKFPNPDFWPKFRIPINVLFFVEVLSSPLLSSLPPSLPLSAATRSRTAVLRTLMQPAFLSPLIGPAPPGLSHYLTLVG